MDTAIVDDVEFATAAPNSTGGTLATIGHRSAPPAVTTHGGGFMSLISKAVDAGNIDLVDKMMSLQERWETNEAKKAFNNSLAAAKAEIKPILKNRHVGFEAKNGGKDTSYDHEDIAGIADQIDGILGNHGLFYRWRPTNDLATGVVTVACIVSHRLGHSEETVLSGKIDVSGNKNHLQAVGSATTYLERYTLKAALGLASKHDDDGRASGGAIRDAGAGSGAAAAAETGEVLSNKQIEDLQDLIVTRGVNISPFLAWVRRKAPSVQKLGDIPAAFFDSCVTSIKEHYPEGK